MYGRHLAQRLVRPLIVVFPLEFVEALLLPSSIGRRRRRRRLF